MSVLVRHALRSGKTLQNLRDELGLMIVEHPDDGRVIFNYHHTDTPKHDPIAKECRGLVLDKNDNWRVVARSFPRFFNWGECSELDKQFDWKTATVSSKEDGSLLLLYWYKGRWYINTRGSFGTGQINRAYDVTWRDLADHVGLSDARLQQIAELPRDITYVFELCSPYNQVVRVYPEPVAFLLTVFDSGEREWPSYDCDLLAECLGCQRPEIYPFNSAAAIQEWVAAAERDNTFEGVVARDGNGLRVKIKNPRYVALHQLWTNGNLIIPKNLVPFLLNGGKDELLTYWPPLREIVETLEARVNGLKAEMLAAWDAAKNEVSQKDFALKIVPATPLSSILFTARKLGKDPRDIWPTCANQIVKTLGLEDPIPAPAGLKRLI